MTWVISVYDRHRHTGHTITRLEERAAITTRIVEDLPRQLSGILVIRK